MHNHASPPAHSRRSFLTQAAAAGAVLGANDRINLALIGARNQGRGVARRAIAAGARVPLICDIDDAIYAAVAPQLEGPQGAKPDYVKDYRRVLDDKRIDAVIIATPDHWHTHMSLLAMQAGKDVFIEKPLSQTIREGQLIRDAARKHRRVVQVGTMRRSGEHFHEAARYAGSGKLGKLCLVRAWMCQVRKSIGNPPDSQPPAGADYDMWLGPAPKRPFNTNRFHYNWRFFWDYGNSELGNQGVHMLDVALMGIQELLGKERSLPTQVSGQGGIYWLDDAKEVPDTQVITYDYGKFMLVWELHSFANHRPIEGAAAGTAFCGTEGTLIVDGSGWRVFGLNKDIVASGKSSPLTHEQNFLECMRSRGLPNADVEIGRLSTTLCHLGNIACHLRRDLKFNPQTEAFGDDRQANALLEKTYRKGFELPRV
ncbi:MAG: Gfo/Idh/MocA family oxidoreductase [Acidobacteria bacterium]|nr:Gfo/Idh/MocA family oxidoreductase [Acidobacteriota bacterium]